MFHFERKLHYITLHYITLHYITLHYITLHYITLQYLLTSRYCLLASQVSILRRITLHNIYNPFSIHTRTMDRLCL